MLPKIPAAPQLPSDQGRWIPFAWATWRSALSFYYKRPPRPIETRERPAVLACCSLLSGLETAPAEWVLYRIRMFEKFKDKIQTKQPPFHFVWSEKAIGDALEEGLPFRGELSVPTVYQPPGWNGDVVQTEREWQDRAQRGEFLWCGAIQLPEAK